MGKIILMLLMLSKINYSEILFKEFPEKTNDEEVIFEEEIVTGKSAFFTNSNLIRVKRKNEDGRPKQQTEESKTEVKSSDKGEENDRAQREEIIKKGESK